MIAKQLAIKFRPMSVESLEQTRLDSVVIFENISIDLDPGTWLSAFKICLIIILNSEELR